MKRILILLVILFPFMVYAIDFKEKIIEAAKDKENQELAKEYAKKAIDYIKNDKTEEIKPVEPELPSGAKDDLKKSNKKSKTKTIKKNKTNK